MTSDKALADRILKNYVQGAHIEYKDRAKGIPDYYTLKLKPPVGPFKSENFRDHIAAHIALARQEGREEVEEQNARIRVIAEELVSAWQNGVLAEIPNILFLELGKFIGMAGFQYINIDYVQQVLLKEEENKEVTE